MNLPYPPPPQMHLHYNAKGRPFYFTGVGRVGSEWWASIRYCDTGERLQIAYKRIEKYAMQEGESKRVESIQNQHTNSRRR